MTPTAAPASYPQWEYQVLAGLGNNKPSAAQLQALSLWAQSEGTNPANNNWLATSLKGSAYPTSGVIAENGGNTIPAYSSQATGVAATVQSIKNNPAIAVVLGAGNTVSLQGIFAVINASSWCKGCQNGLYPVALADFINGNPAKYPGGAVPAGSPPNNSAPTAGASECLLNLPGGICLLNRSQGKAILGGFAVASGVLVLGFGLVLVFATGLVGSRSGKAAAGALSRAPGPVGAAGRAATGSRARRPARSSPGGARSSPAPAAAPAGRHAAQGRHAPGRTGAVSARAVVRNANADEADRDRALRSAGRAQDRRNERARARGEIVSETR